MAASSPLDGWTVWEADGKPVSIRLSPGVVGRLGLAVRQGPTKLPLGSQETGGLLIGSRTKTCNPAVVQVYDFEPVKSEHAAGPSYLLSDRDRLLLAARIAAHEATCKNSSIVGIYRSHTRPDFAITEEDADLFSTYFNNASDVFLLIKPDEDGSLTGGFIIRESGAVVSKSPYVQFPLQGKRVAQAAPATELMIQPLAVRTVQPTALRRTAAQATFWLPAVGLIVLAVALYWGIPSRVPGSSAAKPASTTGLPSPSLDVAFNGNRLRLSWDHRIATRADRGVVWIKDGAETLRLDLDAKQLADGSVVYWPKHSDVEFRFEALSQGASMTASVRAIGRPAEAAVVPATAAAAPVAPKTLHENLTADYGFAPVRPHRNAIGTASRQVLRTVEVSREEPGPTTAIALPDAPAIQPIVATPPSVAFLGTVAPDNRPGGGELPVRVSVEPLATSRRSFPALLRRSVQSDYVPPAVLRDPGLLNPPHRSVARDVNIDVKVYVNPAGKVEFSEVLSKVTEANRELAALAVFSARRWEFVPAR
ncbi:MAG: hypothetical protein ABI806_26845, partial [Candidatus Solibacter sp.]